MGLKGLVLTGEGSETENDLIRYSNYMSGAGSTFGGFMAGLPQDVKELTKGNHRINAFSHSITSARSKCLSK